MILLFYVKNKFNAPYLKKNVLYYVLIIILYNLNIFVLEKMTIIFKILQNNEKILKFFFKIFH